MRSSIFIIMVAALFFAACGSGSDHTATAEETATQKLSGGDAKFTWYTDWDKGIEAAKKENKPVLVDFYADWCHWCKVMDEKTFSADEIKRRFSENWIAIKINSDYKEKQGTYEGKTMSYPQLVRYFKVSGFPSYLFIDKEGNPVTIVSSYLPKEQFGPMLDYMKDELYKKDIKFNDYIKSKG